MLQHMTFTLDMKHPYMYTYIRGFSCYIRLVNINILNGNIWTLKRNKISFTLKYERFGAHKRATNAIFEWRNGRLDSEIVEPRDALNHCHFNDSPRIRRKHVVHIIRRILPRHVRHRACSDVMLLLRMKRLLLRLLLLRQRLALWHIVEEKISESLRDGRSPLLVACGASLSRCRITASGSRGVFKKKKKEKKETRQYYAL